MLIPLLALGACADSEVVGLHIRLAADGTGQFSLRSLRSSGAPAAAEPGVEGVTWTLGGSLHLGQGTFQSLGQVKFGDLVMRADATREDVPRLRVTVPRGPEVQWVSMLVPDQATRQKLAKAFDPSGKIRELGATLRLEVELPGNVIASGVDPTARGVEADRERNRAYLLVPASTALGKGDPLTWDVTWR